MRFWLKINGQAVIPYDSDQADLAGVRAELMQARSNYGQMFLSFHDREIMVDWNNVWTLEIMDDEPAGVRAPA